MTDMITVSLRITQAELEEIDRAAKDLDLTRTDVIRARLRRCAVLERLAAYRGVTQRAMLERLVAEAESAIVDELRGDDQKLYYAKIPVTA